MHVSDLELLLESSELCHVAAVFHRLNLQLLHLLHPSLVSFECLFSVCLAEHHVTEFSTICAAKVTHFFENSINIFEPNYLSVQSMNFQIPTGFWGFGVLGL